MSISLDAIKGLVDEAKNMAMPKTDIEKRLYEALSNKNWGASSTLMNQIAADTYDFEKYSVIMKSLWAAVDGPGRTWRSVFKALTLMEHLIKNGAERVIEDIRDHMHKVRTLSDFSYWEGSTDRGSGVREKAKQLVELLNDNERIREERDKARRLRDKFVGIGATGGYAGTSGGLGGVSGSGRFDGFSAQDFHSSPYAETRDSVSASSYRERDRPKRYSDARASEDDYGGSRSGGSGGGSYRDKERDFDDRGGRDRSAYDDRRSGSRDVGRYDDPISPVGDDDGARTRGRKKSKDKLEIKMRKEAAKPAATDPSPSAAKAQDLLGDDFFGGAGAGAAGSAQPQGGFGAFGDDGFDDFNPRGSSTAAPPPAPVAATDDFFAAPALAAPPSSTVDLFSAAPPQPPVAQNYSRYSQPTHARAPSFSADPFGGGSDIFAGGPPPPAPASVQQGVSGFGLAPFGAPQQQPLDPGFAGFGGFQAPAPAPAPAPSVLYGQPQQQQPQLQHHHQQQSRGPPLFGGAGDFGDFQGTSAAARAAPAPAPSHQQLPSRKPSNDPWGGLVDLGALSIEDTSQKKHDGMGVVGAAHKAGLDADNSFADLDAFGRTKQQHHAPQASLASMRPGGPLNSPSTGLSHSPIPMSGPQGSYPRPAYGAGPMGGMAMQAQQQQPVQGGPGGFGSVMQPQQYGGMAMGAMTGMGGRYPPQQQQPPPPPPQQQQHTQYGQMPPAQFGGYNTPGMGMGQQPMQGLYGQQQPQYGGAFSQPPQQQSFANSPFPGF